MSKVARCRRSTLAVGISCFILGWTVNGIVNSRDTSLIGSRIQTWHGINATTAWIRSKSRKTNPITEDYHNSSLITENLASDARSSSTLESTPVPTNATSILPEKVEEKKPPYTPQIDLTLPSIAKDDAQTPFMGALDEVGYCVRLPEHVHSLLAKLALRC
jgi:hypothetical protein